MKNAYLILAFSEPTIWIFKVGLTKNVFYSIIHYLIMRNIAVFSKKGYCTEAMLQTKDISRKNKRFNIFYL